MKNCAAAAPAKSRSPIKTYSVPTRPSLRAPTPLNPGLPRTSSCSPAFCGLPRSTRKSKIWPVADWIVDRGMGGGRLLGQRRVRGTDVLPLSVGDHLLEVLQGLDQVEQRLGVQPFL